MPDQTVEQDKAIEVAKSDLKPVSIEPLVDGIGSLLLS